MTNIIPAPPPTVFGVRMQLLTIMPARMRQTSSAPLPDHHVGRFIMLVYGAAYFWLNDRGSDIKLLFAGLI